MSSKNLSRRNFLSKTGIALGAVAFGQALPGPLSRLLGNVAFSASPGLLGGTPLSTIVKNGNVVQFLIVDNLYANKGIVNAAENDRFTFEVRADYFHTQLGYLVASVLPQEFGGEASGDADLRMGSTIKVVPLTLAIPAEGATLVKTVLDGGSSVTYQTTIALVLTDASGGKHYLASVVVTGAIAPAPILAPFLDPDHGQPGTPFKVIDDAGRLAEAKEIRFTEPGKTPELGEKAPYVTVINANTVESEVPGMVAAATYWVTVHNGSAQDGFLPIFGALPFIVE